MKSDEVMIVCPVRRWHTSDEGVTWELRHCVTTFGDIKLIEHSRILRQMGGTFPTPHQVIAVIMTDGSFVIEPDELARDFLLEWFSFTQAFEPEKLVTFLMESW